MFGTAPFPVAQVVRFSFPHSATLFQSQMCELRLQQTTLNAEWNDISAKPNNREKSTILCKLRPETANDYRMNTNITKSMCFQNTSFRLDSCYVMTRSREKP